MPMLMKSGQTMKIGNAHGVEYMNGAIDEVWLFNRILSPNEITSLYINNSIPSPSNVLPDNTAVNITAGGATLDLNNFQETIGSLGGVTGNHRIVGQWRIDHRRR